MTDHPAPRAEPSGTAKLGWPAWFLKFGGSPAQHASLFFIHAAILIFAIMAWIDASEQRKVATEQYKLLVNGTQAQSAFTLLDQAAALADDITSKPDSQEILKTKGYDPGLDEILDRYQLILLKSSYLHDKELYPDAWWPVFLQDFCRMYNSYPYIQNWWTRQLGTSEYIRLSSSYAELSSACKNPKNQKRHSSAISWGSVWNA